MNTTDLIIIISGFILLGMAIYYFRNKTVIMTFLTFLILILEGSYILFIALKIQDLKMNETITIVIAALVFFITLSNIIFGVIHSQSVKEDEFLMIVIENHLNILMENKEKIKDFYNSKLKEKFTEKGEYTLTIHILTKKIYEIIKNNPQKYNSVLSKELNADADIKKVQISFKEDFSKNKDACERILMCLLKEKYSGGQLYNSIPLGEKKKITDNIIEFLKGIQTTDIAEGLLDDILDGFNDEEQTMASLGSYNFENAFQECNELFVENFNEIGHVFRNSYRVFKLILNTYKRNPVKQKEYLGLLRSYYSEEFLLVLFYNSSYTNQGAGYAKLLKEKNFFGNNSDLQEDRMHFRKNNLIFRKIDIKILKDFYMNKNNFENHEQNIYSTLKDICD